MSKDNIAMFEADRDEFLQIIVTVAEAWANHHYQPEKKSQSKQWKHQVLQCQRRPGRQGHGHRVLGCRRRASSGLFRKGAHHHRIILCRSLETTRRQNQRKTSGNAGQRGVAPPGQCTGPQVGASNGCSASVLIQTGRTAALFT